MKSCKISKTIISYPFHHDSIRAKLKLCIAVIFQIVHELFFSHLSTFTIHKKRNACHLSMKAQNGMLVEAQRFHDMITIFLPRGSQDLSCHKFNGTLYFLKSNE